MNKINGLVIGLLVVLAALVGFMVFKSKNIPTSINQPMQQPAQQALSTVLPDGIRAQENWPPVIQQSANTYTCTPGVVGADVQTTTTQKTINGRVYCVQAMAEGAAGTTYHTFSYTTAATTGSGTETTQFILGYTNCGVYRDNSTNGGAQYVQCEADQAAFDIDAIIDSLM